MSFYRCKQNQHPISLSRLTDMNYIIIIVFNRIGARDANYSQGSRGRGLFKHGRSLKTTHMGYMSHFPCILALPLQLWYSCELASKEFNIR